MNLIVQVIFYKKIHSNISFLFYFNFYFTYNLIIHVMPLLNQHQVYPKVHLYIPILIYIKKRKYFFCSNVFILDTEDDQMYIVQKENHIIFHASIRENKIKNEMI